MTTMKTGLRACLRDESGVTAIGYGILAAAITAAIFGASGTDTSGTAQ